MRGFVANVPWFLPAFIASIIVAVVAGPRVARRLGCSPAIGVLLLASVGLIVAATLTPLVDAIEGGVWSSGTCSTRRVGYATPATYLRLSEATLNVLLFVPLGIAIGLLPWSRRTAALVVSGLVLTLLVEGTQMLVPLLGRGCETADIVDNGTGLLLGVAMGRIGALAGHRVKG